MSGESVFEMTFKAIMAEDLAQKQNLITRLHDELATDCQRKIHLNAGDPIKRIDAPGLPPAVKLVHPRQLQHRGLGSVEGRAGLIHALAHIEFNAINLALDAVYRFRGLPVDYYLDWISVASEEALHHEMLCNRLQELGHLYGDFPAHNGLWDAALRSDNDLITRMAIVPCVFEARGLDVTPGMVSRLRQVGDDDSASILEKILSDEIGHVAIGNRWFKYACQRKQLDPASTLIRLIKEKLPTQRFNGELNLEGRRLAGFNQEQIDALVQQFSG